MFALKLINSYNLWFIHPLDVRRQVASDRYNGSRQLERFRLTSARNTHFSCGGGDGGCGGNSTKQCTCFARSIVNTQTQCYDFVARIRLALSSNHYCTNLTVCIDRQCRWCVEVNIYMRVRLCVLIVWMCCVQCQPVIQSVSHRMAIVCIKNSTRYRKTVHTYLLFHSLQYFVICY